MLDDLLHNRALVIPFGAWLLCQLSKGLFDLTVRRRLDFVHLLSSGGMPSSHSALVTALAATVARVEGMGSAAFAISLFVAAIVMYDATGVRRYVGIQAGILNKLLATQGHPSPHGPRRLRELVGHSPFEVLVGALIGLGMALLFG